MNYLKTGILMVLMAALFLAIGALLGGRGGLVIGLVISLVFNFAMFWFSEAIALKFAGARPLQPNEFPWLQRVNEELCRRAEIPPARLHISPDQQPNAFACGRGPGNASICFNEGLVKNLSEREVSGVLAHEIAHIANRDTLTMTIVAATASAIMFVSRFALFFSGDEERPNPILAIVVMIVGPIAAMLIQMAVSRVREYAADETGAKLLWDPLPLADALESLHRTTQVIPAETAQPATAHMYIASPLSGQGITAMFSTHPPMEERVRRLRTLSVAAV